MYQHIVIILLLFVGLVNELSGLSEPHKVIEDKKLLTQGSDEDKQAVLSRRGCMMTAYFILNILALTTDQWPIACILFFIGLIPKVKLAIVFGVGILIVDALVSTIILLFITINHFMLQIPYNLWAKAWLISVFNPS